MWSFVLFDIFLSILNISAGSYTLIKCFGCALCQLTVSKSIFVLIKGLIQRDNEVAKNCCWSRLRTWHKWRFVSCVRPLKEGEKCWRKVIEVEQIWFGEFLMVSSRSHTAIPSWQTIQGEMVMQTELDFCGNCLSRWMLLVYEGEKKGSTDCIIFDSMGIASSFPFFSSPSSFFIRLKFCRGYKKWSEPAGLIKQKLKRFIQLWEYFNEFVLSLKVLFSENSCSCGILHCLDFVQWEIV